MSNKFENLGTRNITRCVIQTELDLSNADIGGTANVYRGIYTRPNDRRVVEIAIKAFRAGGQKVWAGKTDPRMEKELVREITVWATLSRTPHDNVLQLLGLIETPLSSYPALVSERCQYSLQMYFEERPEEPQYLKFMKEILQGLTHMHSLSPPIVHGDLKFQNILLSSEGTLKLCDFGQSQFSSNRTSSIPDASTTFHATYRYMSPELFSNDQKVRPTMFSDVWAYGCVALQVLSGLVPYHTIKSDSVLLDSIAGGVVPSIKPERPYAPRCLDHILWDLVRSCWTHANSRPSSLYLLNELNGLLEQNRIGTSSPTQNRMSINFDTGLPEWPPHIAEFGPEDGVSRELLIHTPRSNVYIRYKVIAKGSSSSLHPPLAPKQVVKVARSTGSSAASEKDFFLHLLILMVRERYSLQHQNLVEILGIDTSFQPHPGLVFEFCKTTLLDHYKPQTSDRTQHNRIQNLIQILSGLQYLHTFPTPIAHGDLNPKNILVDASGTLKLTLFSFSRLIAEVPEVEELHQIGEWVETARYLSPEMIHITSRPSTSADMWAFGCIVFWMYTNLLPYYQIQEEGALRTCILKGVLPYSNQRFLHRADWGTDRIQSTRSAWLHNGTSDLAEKCWLGTDRPTAAEFLRFVKSLPSGIDTPNDTWSLGVTNLSGRLASAEPMAGGITAIWRRSRSSTHQSAVYVTLLTAKASFKRGIFRTTTEATVKFTHTKNTVAFFAAQESMKHELRILVQLNHPNIGLLWGYDQVFLGNRELPAVVTEYCTNGTLKEYMFKYAEELDRSKRIKLVGNILKGVEYLHEGVSQGIIVHGNLNMVTVVVDKHGAPKIRDFEFAFQYMRRNQPDLLPRPLYSPSLMPQASRWQPPEFFIKLDDFPLTTRHADLWSVGCLLLAVMSGNEPYATSDTPTVFTRIKSGEAPYSQEECLFEGVWRISERLWATNPLDRISSANALQLLSAYN